MTLSPVNQVTSTSPYHFDTGWKVGNHVLNTTTQHEQNLIIPANEEFCFLVFDFFQQTGTTFYAQQVAPSFIQNGVTTALSSFYYHYRPSEQLEHNMYKRYAQSSASGTTALSTNRFHRASNGTIRFGDNQTGTFTMVPNLTSSFLFTTDTASSNITFYYRVRAITKDLAEGLSA
jgi:hypothetical protein